jgi:hypothetical protein
MQRNDVMHVLNDPLAQELIRSNIPARVAYTSVDGSPRGATLLVQLTLAHSSTAARRHVPSQLSSKTDARSRYHSVWRWPPVQAQRLARVVLHYRSRQAIASRQ